MRGAGANLGIATSFDYRLHPVGPVLGGLVLYSLSDGRHALRAFDDFASSAPDEVSTVALLLTTPDGTPAVGLGACYCGPIAEGERVLKPLRTLAPPLADFIAPQPYIQMQTLFDEAWAPGRMYYNKSSVIRRLSEAAIELLLKSAHAMPHSGCVSFSGQR